VITGQQIYSYKFRMHGGNDINQRNFKYFILSILVILCASFDLSTKWLAKQYLHQAQPIQIVENYLELRYTENTAIAFSMLHSVEPGLRKWIIYTLSSIAIVFLLVIIWKIRRQSFLGMVSLMFILSGAIGNISERIVRGYVIDFIHLHYYDKFSWPVFNVADILITCGAILLGLLMLKKSSESDIQNMETI